MNDVRGNVNRRILPLDELAVHPDFAGPRKRHDFSYWLILTYLSAEVRLDTNSVRRTNATGECRSASAEVQSAGCEGRKTATGILRKTDSGPNAGGAVFGPARKSRQRAPRAP